MSCSKGPNCYLGEQSWGGIKNYKLPKVRDDCLRDVIGKVSSRGSTSKRQEIARRYKTSSKRRLMQYLTKPVVLDSVELRNIALPQKIQTKIEELQAEKQNVMIAEQQKERAKREAERKAEVARGEAQKKRIEAQGHADKIRIEAEAQAKANRLISDSLSENLLRLKQIHTQREFNEALRVNRDAKIFLTPGGAVPNIWVDTKSRSEKVISTTSVSPDTSNSVSE